MAKSEYSEQDITRFALKDYGTLIDNRLRQRGVKSVEVLDRGGKRYLRTWYIEFDISEYTARKPR